MCLKSCTSLGVSILASTSFSSVYLDYLDFNQTCLLQHSFDSGILKKKPILPPLYSETEDRNINLFAYNPTE